MSPPVGDSEPSETEPSHHVSCKAGSSLAFVLDDSQKATDRVADVPLDNVRELRVRRFSELNFKWLIFVPL